MAKDAGSASDAPPQPEGPKVDALLRDVINSLIQSAKARAPGFRSASKMKTIIYLLLSKLDFRLPSAIPNGIHLR
jgi:hypothetical protein